MKALTRYRFPFVLGVLGSAFGVLAILFFVDLIRNDGTSFVGPGAARVRVPTPGDYRLWHVARGIVDGNTMNAPDALPAGAVISVRRVGDGAKFSLTQKGNAQVETGSTRRVAVVEVTLDRAGEYEITVAGLKQEHGFYFAEAKILRTLGMIAGTASLAFAFLVGAVIWALLILLRGR